MNDEPAGTHGFVRAEQGHFADQRGARLRFFGVNLTGIACLPDHDTAQRLARHLRKLGFNAVRLHALDTPGAMLASDGQFEPEALERLDYFSAALKAHGLYFSLGLHAAAAYPQLSAEALARFPQGKLLDRMDPQLLAEQKDFARRLLSHENVHTHQKYSDEPALLYVELGNEDTIFPSWAGTPDEAPPSYRARLAQGYAPWLAARTAEGLRSPGPAEEEAKAELPTFQSSANARADYAQYLRATERNAVKELTTFVKTDLGLRSMLINTQASFGGLAGVLREAELSDFIDVHGYWDPPRSADGKAWSIQNSSQISAPEAGTLGVMASYRVYGKPYSVSEYATPAPNDYAAETLPLLIAIAGLQDWDAVFAFAYADQKRDYEPQRINGVFDLAGHPAKLAFVSTAASAFRRGLVAASQSRVELSVPEQPSRLPFAENALPSLWAEQGVPPSAAALRQLGISLRPGAGDAQASHSLHVSGPLGSDTGQLLWENQGPHARLSVDAPALKLVCGMISGSRLELGQVGFEFKEFSPGFACASLIALDEQSIEKSQRLLLTVAGLARNAGRPARSDAQLVSALGSGPALAQFVPITVSLPLGAWRAEALDATGAPVRALAVSNGKDSRVSITRQGAALSYAITR